MQENIELQPKKDYHEPMHTAEHILNQTMVRMFGCKRSVNAHIERKKSKADYFLTECPSDEQMKEVESRVNEIIDKHLDITESMMSRDEAQKVLDLAKLPDDAGDLLRVVYVGDYDACACIGHHVKNTSEIGRFVLLNYDFNEGRLRIRFKLQ
ncbi:MAG: hypothetical protein ACRC77_01775 [Bacteroidales bacterium]